MPTLAKSKDAVQTIKIDAKRAVEIAIRYFGEFFPQLAAASALEEIEEGDDGKCWLITLGFDVKKRHENAPALKLASYFTAREYKTFKIDNTSGKVTSMKIRTL